MKMILMPKDIIFQFVDEVIGGTVRNTMSESGIIIAGQQVDAQQKPRWGKVIGKGDMVDADIQVGKYILITALQWTRGFTFDSDAKYWRTNEESVLATAEHEIKEL